MTERTQQIIEEIHQFPLDELELIMEEISKRIVLQRRVESILDEFVGAGEGFWQTDAQLHVEELRSEE